MRSTRNFGVLLTATALCGAGACAARSRAAVDDTRVARFAATIADSVRSEAIAPGVRLHHLVNNAAPWRAVVLEADLGRCVTLRAVKGAAVAIGRSTTSALLAGLDVSLRPVAAANADFFSFTPPGVPVNAHVENSTLLSGPINRPVFAITADGRAWIGQLTVAATLLTARGTVALTTWNRPAARVAGLVDAGWGIPLDSIVAPTAWVLSPVAGATGPRTLQATTRTYVAAPLPRSRASVVTGDTLLIIGLRAQTGQPAPLATGDTVRVSRTLAPITPREAVGGQPQLLRDSTVAGAVDSVNNAAFRGLNPRTAVGYGDRGRRVLLAVIDGRQPGYSMGMSLRQTADLFRALGATDAINLDGGGSSALVVTDASARGHTRALNHPSDSAGERPVANALAVLRSCR